uniref:TNase-like domain-containing protein n=1 Tax=viral metagenome TaxID=1070528 RepID=A0A6C0H7V9_9ZZZZ
MQGPPDFSEYHRDNTPKFSLAGICNYARLVDVYDGDTMTCIIPFEDKYFQFACRLNGIDTDEIKNKNMKQKELAYQARHHALQFCCPEYHLDVNTSRHEIQDYLRQNVTAVWIKCYEFDKYGRVMIDLYKEPEQIEHSLTQHLLAKGLGYEYHGGTKKQRAEV